MKKYGLIVVLFIVFLLPIIFVVINGVIELNVLNGQNRPVFSYGSMGEVEKVEYGDILPAQLVNGTFTKGDLKLMTIDKCKNPMILVDMGAEVTKGDPLAYCGKTQTYSSFSGEIYQIRNEDVLTIAYYDYDNVFFTVKAKTNQILKLNRDFKNEFYELSLKSISTSIDGDGNVEIVYEVHVLNQTTPYIGETSTQYFSDDASIKDQKLVPKSAVFKENGVSLIRVLNNDGSVVGDLKAVILHENQSQYAIDVEGHPIEYFDWTYGRFKNSLEFGENYGN